MRWFDVLLIALVIALATGVAVQPMECHLIARPVFGPDADSPIGVGVDGARITEKCVF